MKYPIIIINPAIPFKGFAACNLFGVIFARKELKSHQINHEMIHTAQMKELLYVGFYLWYFFEWLILLLYYRNAKKAYYSIRFEKEAYSHQFDYAYIKNRKSFSWLKY